MAFTKDQAEVWRVLTQTDENVFLTGEAGTGKSYVIQEYIKSKPGEILVCASTGKAALNIGGTTLHRVFKLATCPLVSPSVTPSALLEAADIVLIDEISMCRADVFDAVSLQIRKEKQQKSQFL